MEARTPPVTTILILDDNHTVLQMLGLVLRASGTYRILEASTEQEAIAHLDQRGGDVDVLVADVCIDERPGRMIADRLTMHCPHLRVLFISGYPKDNLVTNGWLDPNDAFLAKPFTPARLMRRVEEVLAATYAPRAAGAMNGHTACASGAA